MTALVWAYKNVFGEPRLSYGVGVAQAGEYKFETMLKHAKKHVANQVRDGKLLYVQALPHRITIATPGETWGGKVIAKGPWPEIWDTFVAHVHMWM